MKVYWGKEKIGDPLILVNRHNLWKILEEELKGIDGCFFIKNRIINKCKKSKIDHPFRHLTQKKVNKLLMRPEKQ